MQALRLSKSDMPTVQDSRILEPVAAAVVEDSGGMREEQLMALFFDDESFDDPYRETLESMAVRIEKLSQEVQKLLERDAEFS